MLVGGDYVPGGKRMAPSGFRKVTLVVVKALDK